MRILNEIAGSPGAAFRHHFGPENVPENTPESGRFSRDFPPIIGPFSALFWLSESARSAIIYQVKMPVGGPSGISI
jgi:hypothetical protein